MDRKQTPELKQGYRAHEFLVYHPLDKASNYSSPGEIKPKYTVVPL